MPQQQKSLFRAPVTFSRKGRWLRPLGASSTGIHPFLAAVL